MNLEEFKIKHLKQLDANIETALKQATSDNISTMSMVNTIRRIALDEIFVVLTDYHKTFIEPVRKD